MTKTGSVGGWVAVVVLLCLSVLLAVPGDLIRHIPNPESPTLGDLDFFGQSVATLSDGLDLVVVGAPFDDPGGVVDAGSVYVFDTDGNLALMIPNPEPEPGDQFGASVAGSSFIVVGAPLDDPGGMQNAGSVYVFDSGGTLEDVIHSPDPDPSDRFGFSVASLGAMVVVGELFGEQPGSNLSDGAAYLFEIGGMAPTIPFVNPNLMPNPLDQFGFSVAVVPDGIGDLDSVVVGAPFDDGAGLDAGIAYVFETDGVLRHTLDNPSPNADDVFGQAVAAVSDGVGGFEVAVGEPGGVGSVHFFDPDPVAGGLLVTIPDPDAQADARFGSSIAPSGADVLVGVPFFDDGGVIDAGQLHIFGPPPGRPLVTTIANPTPDAQDQFGRSVAGTTDGRLVSSAIRDLGPGVPPDVGTVHIFDATTFALITTIANPEAPTVFIGNDLFGFSLASTGNRILVGAPLDDPPDATAPGTFVRDGGSVYVLNATDGSLVRILSGSTSQALFGRSVAAGGATVVVGAPNAPDGGSVHAFNLVNGWLLFTIPNPDPAESDNFGFAVATGGGRIAVGDPFDDPDGVGDAGSVYVFHAQTGALQLVIPNPEPDPFDQFGFAVVVDGDRVLVGAPGDEGGEGAVWVFDAASEVPQGKHQNPTAGADRFGSSLVAAGEGFVVGAPLKSVGGTGQAGAVYVFDDAGAGTFSVIEHPAPSFFARFGTSVAVTGDHILVGAPLHLLLGSGVRPGFAYVFDAATGALLLEVPNPDPELGLPRFGTSVSGGGLGQRYLYVGAPFDDLDGDVDAGSVYQFELPEDDDDAEDDDDDAEDDDDDAEDDDDDAEDDDDDDDGGD